MRSRVEATSAGGTRLGKESSTVATESAAEVLKHRQAEAGDDEQGEDRCELECDGYAARHRPPRDTRPNRVGRDDRGGSPGGNRDRDKGGSDAEERGDGEHRPIRRKIERKRLGRGKEREDAATDPRRCQETAGSAGCSKQQAFNEQLPKESRAARAERAA